MDFYSEVTERTALAWYNALPPHLKKQVDTALAAHTQAGVHERVMKLDPDLSKRVSKAIGYTLPAHVVVNNTPDGNTLEECARFDKRKAWCLKYNELLQISVIVDNAPRMQKERKMLSQALGLTQGGSGLPNQAEGLDDTQAATIRWIQSTGQTPIEFLAETYRNDEVKVSDRIQAARAMLDFVHRKVPQQVEVKGPSTEEQADAAAAVRDIGKQLAELAQLKKEKK